jgi:uncharacterized protein
MTAQKVKRAFSIALIVVVSIAMDDVLARAKAPTAKSLLWEISGNGINRPSYLFGTLHEGCRSKLALPLNQLQMLENVQQIYLEISLEEFLGNPSQAQVVEATLIPNGQTLEDITTPAEYQELETAFGSATVRRFARINPKYLPIIVGYNLSSRSDLTILLRKLCKDEIASVEKIIIQTATRYRKKIYGIETLKERDANIEKSVSVKEDLQVLLSNIRGVDNSPAYDEFIKTMELYSAQDINGSHDNRVRGLQQQPDTLKALVYDRNSLWLTKMQKIMSEKPTFFAFGVVHLGGGKGLISLLESRGYTLKPIFKKPSPSELATNTDREYLESGNQKVGKSNLLGALEDYNRSLTLNPKYAEAYFRRGIVKEELFDNSGALADYNKAISIDAKYDYYEQRGSLKSNRLKDFLGAIEDLNQCIKIQPEYIAPYYRRGLLRSEKLGDFSGALSDFNKVIDLRPQSMSAHLARGVLKYNKLNDRAGGIADVKRALMFAKFYNDISLIDEAQATLKVMEGGHSANQ